MMCPYETTDFNKTYICVYKMVSLCSVDLSFIKGVNSFNSKHLHVSKLLVSLTNEDILWCYGLVMT